MHDVSRGVVGECRHIGTRDIADGFHTTGEVEVANHGRALVIDVGRDVVHRSPCTSRRWEVRRLPDRRHFGMPQALLFCFLMVTPAVLSQTPHPEQLTIPSGTPIEAKLAGHIPMKVGQPVQASLAHPVFADNKSHCRLEPCCMVGGELEPDRELRSDARLNADFTPYHRPTVAFTAICFRTGLISRCRRRHLLMVLRPSILLPGRGEASQPDWHGCRRGEGVGLFDERSVVRARAWGPHGAAVLSSAAIPSGANPAGYDVDLRTGEPVSVRLAARICEAGRPLSGDSEKKNVELHAYLDEKLSSSDAKVGEQFQATVAEPVRGADQSRLFPRRCAGGDVLRGRSQHALSIATEACDLISASSDARRRARSRSSGSVTRSRGEVRRRAEDGLRGRRESQPRAR